MVTYRKKKKKDSTWTIVAGIAALGLVGFLIFSQKSKSPPPDSVEPVTETVEIVESEVAVNSPAEIAPVVFSDIPQQQQFASLYASFKSVFTPPTPGTPIRVFKKDGGRIEGELSRFTPSGLVLSTPDGLINVTRDEMDEATRQQLFAEDFSRSQAENKVLAGLDGSPPSNLSELLLKPEAMKTIEARRFTADRLNTRYGPSRRYADVPGGELFRGQTVYVVAETNAWICVKETENANTVMGWIPKFSTFTLNPEDKAKVAREVRSLMDNGFVIIANPLKNEVLIDYYEWQITDAAAIEGQCRLLAFYCGHQRNSRLFWVDIRDALTMRKIAEYSESKGFKKF